MAVNVKEEAHRLIDSLPENTTWDGVMHAICVRQAIERGVEDSKAGRTTDVGVIREKYGLPRT